MDYSQNTELNDFHSVLDEARKLAIQFKHGFVDFNHLYVALFNIDCEAREYCNKINDDDWHTWLQEYYPASDGQVIDDSVPITVYAGNVIFNANTFVHINGDAYACSVHILLALLCLDCEITKAINRRGVIFEDIAEQYYQKPIEKTCPPVSVLKNKPYSKLEKLFINEKSREEKIELLYSQAIELYWYQQYDDCLSVCETGLSLKPDHLNFKTLRINCYVSKRDFKPSEYYVTAFLKDYPDQDNYKLTLAWIYDETGRYNEGAEISDKLLLTNPQDDIALNNKGFNLLLQEKFEEAIPFFERAIAIKPTFAYAWNNLGFVHFKLGQINKALELINKSLELDKGNSFAYKNKGIISLEQNDKAEALNNFKMALRYGYTKKYGHEVLELMKKC
jgi:tetratricopeptide (TPR) repeat protein